MNEEEVALVLRESANSSSPGLDGITYKFYKMLQQINRKTKRRNTRA